MHNYTIWEDVMRSFISIVLTIIMLLSFVACSGGSTDQPQDTTLSGDTTASKPQNDIVYEEDDLPDDLRFDGETVKFLIVKTGVHDLFAEELSSDIVNDSIYNRENFVEERLGVELEPMYIDPMTGGDFEKEIEKQHASDEDMYQLLGYSTFAFTRFVFMNYFHDLYGVNYIDLEKPWWSQTFNNEAEIKDSLYVTTGSLSLSLARSMFAIFYNKNVADEYAASIPELGDLYGLVDSGDWTFDKFHELGSTIYEDNNGDTTADEEDRFGLGFSSGIGIDFFWSSFDINLLSPTDDGWFESDIPTEKLYTSLEKMNTLLFDTPGCFDAGYGDEKLDTLSTMLAGDNLLFMNNTLDAIETTTLRNMQSDYGILPTPKFNEAQDNYYTYAHDSYTSFAIPKTNRNPDVAGAVLEAMASYAYRETEPAYLNTALKGKYMSDPQSRKMLDLVVDGFKVDAAWIYLETLGAEYPSEMRIAIHNGDTNFASKHTTLERRMNLRLKAYLAGSSFD